MNKDLGTTTSSTLSNQPTGDQRVANAAVMTERSKPTLRCDMCGKPLKGARFKIEARIRPGSFLTVGPDCFRAEKKAREEMSAERLAELRNNFARAQGGAS